MKQGYWDAFRRHDKKECDMSEEPLRLEGTGLSGEPEVL